MTDLGTLGGTVSEGLGINDAGDVVGYSRWTTTISNVRAFHWNGQEMIDLAGSQLSSSRAWAINNHRQIVGWGLAGGETFAFLHDPLHGLINLQDCLAPNPGWTDLNPRDMNDAGQIVGTGTNPQGFRHAFLMNPLPPIPAASSWTLGVIAVALAIAGSVVLRKAKARA
jgi:probable HAF family extracellular repeat protein